MSYSHAVNTGSSFSNPQNMYTSQSTAAQNFAYTAAALGQQVYQWAAQTYAGDTAMTQESVQNYLQMSQLGLGLANENLTDYNNIYRPEMAQLANEAGSYSSAARQEVNEGAAEAQSEVGSQAGLSAAQQQLQSYGINPNSGMYAELLESQQAGAGAAAAGAGQEAGLATQQTGRQLLQASLQQGDQLPAAAVNALNSAYEGVAGAENSTLANANTGANMFAIPNQYLGTALNLKYPPIGNVQQASQVGVSNATPRQQQSGGGGGGGGRYAPGANPIPGNSNMQQPGAAYGASTGAGGRSIPNAGGVPGIHNVGDFADPNQQGQGQGGIDNQDLFDPTDANLGSGISNSDIQDYMSPGSPTPGAFPGGSGGPGTGFGGGTSALPSPDQFSMASPDTGANSWGSISNMADMFNPVGSANAGTINPSPYNAGGNYGGIQPVQENAPPQEQPEQPQQSGDYSAPPPEDNSGGYGGGYAAGGRVRGDVRHGIPLQHGAMLPASVTQRMLPQAFAGGGIPATRMGGFHSNAPSLRSMAGGGPTTGGFVPRGASPSQGRQTDDIPSRLNAEEFVMPRDVTKWYGQKFFQDLIKKARAASATGGAQPQAKPMAPAQLNKPRFVSRPMGQ